MRMAPLRDYMPHLLCFGNAHEASVCRVANFCTKSVDMNDFVSGGRTYFCSLRMKSWQQKVGEYGVHKCVLDMNVWEVSIVDLCSQTCFVPLGSEDRSTIHDVNIPSKSVFLKEVLLYTADLLI
jgi:hypothetical protein